MLKDGEISTRSLKLNSEGVKSESSIIAEMIFDVNTEYFESQYERHGYESGYDFAKAFYTEAYKMAITEIGDEKYVLGATMHADEMNKSLSEQLGRPVFHYHLHVCYLPVVRKEILWSKRCKDPALVGTVKKVINQVNHSKKWESEKVVGEDGKEKLIYSYSKLQDRYHDHMKAAGFSGFERGEKGSTAEHLSVLDYKTKERQKELAEKEKELDSAEKALAQRAEKLAEADKTLASKSNLLFQKENIIGDLKNKEKELKKALKGKLLTAKQIEKIHAKALSDPNRSLFAFGKNKEGDDKLTILRKDFNDIAITAIENSKQISALKKHNKELSDANKHLNDKKIPALKENLYHVTQSHAESQYKNQNLERHSKNLEREISQVPKEVWEQYNPPAHAVAQKKKRDSRADDNR